MDIREVSYGSKRSVSPNAAREANQHALEHNTQMLRMRGILFIFIILIVRTEKPIQKKCDDFIVVVTHF